MELKGYPIGAYSLRSSYLYQPDVTGPWTACKQVRSAAPSTAGVAPSARRSTASSKAISRPISRSPARGHFDAEAVPAYVERELRAECMPARGVSEVLPQVWQDRLEHDVRDRGRRVVVEVDGIH